MSRKKKRMTAAVAAAVVQEISKQIKKEVPGCGLSIVHTGLFL